MLYSYFNVIFSLYLLFLFYSNRIEHNFGESVSYHGLTLMKILFFVFKQVLEAILLMMGAINKEREVKISFLIIFLFVVNHEQRGKKQFDIYIYICDIEKRSKDD